MMKKFFHGLFTASFTITYGLIDPNFFDKPRDFRFWHEAIFNFTLEAQMPLEKESNSTNLKNNYTIGFTYTNDKYWKLYFGIFSPKPLPTKTPLPLFPNPFFISSISVCSISLEDLFLIFSFQRCSFTKTKQIFLHYFTYRISKKFETYKCCCFLSIL